MRVNFQCTVFLTGLLLGSLVALTNSAYAGWQRRIPAVSCWHDNANTAFDPAWHGVRSTSGNTEAVSCEFVNDENVVDSSGDTLTTPRHEDASLLSVAYVDCSNTGLVSAQACLRSPHLGVTESCGATASSGAATSSGNLSFVLSPGSTTAGWLNTSFPTNSDAYVYVLISAFGNEHGSGVCVGSGGAMLFRGISVYD